MSEKEIEEAKKILNNLTDEALDELASHIDAILQARECDKRSKSNE